MESELVSAANPSDTVTAREFFTIAGLPGILLLFRPLLMLWLTRGRDPRFYDVVDTSAMVQIVYSMIALLVGAYYFSKSDFFRQILLKTPMRYLMFYSLLAILSAVWSVNWRISFYRGLECFAWQLLVTAVFAELSTKKNITGLVDWVLSYSLWAIAISIFSKVRAMGFSFQILYLEQFNSTSFFFLALILTKNKIKRWFIVPVSILSQSNVAYFGMAAGLFGLGTGSKKMKIGLFAAGIGIMVAIVFIGGDRFLHETLFYGQPEVGMQAGNGRVNYYTKAWDVISENPYLGYGFVAGEIELATKAAYGIIGIHNFFLASLLGMGVAGLILMLLFFTGLFVNARSGLLPPAFRAAFFGSASIIFFHSLGNPGLGSRLYGTWLPSIIIATLICCVQLLSRFEYADPDVTPSNIA